MGYVTFSFEVPRTPGLACQNTEVKVTGYDAECIDGEFYFFTRQVSTVIVDPGGSSHIGCFHDLTTRQRRTILDVLEAKICDLTIAFSAKTTQTGVIDAQLVRYQSTLAWCQEHLFFAHDLKPGHPLWNTQGYVI